MLENKYKERDPKETIDIIKTFFEINGYTIKVFQNQCSEAETWSCGISLYKKNLLIMSTCGKGMTELYSLASGFAELYERFCNTCEHIRNLTFSQTLINTNKYLYNYYFHPDEKSLSYEDIMDVPVFKNFFETFFHTEQNIKKYFNILTDNNLIGEPYTDLKTGKIYYYDRRILNRVITSNGMAAGNTLEEALNQGLSEICERIVTAKFFENEYDKYYLIDSETIKNNQLKEKINKIKENNCDFYIFDLSYNTNLPVIMSVLINRTQRTTNINFGSFPIFEIALERTITEMYQGIASYNNFSNYQIPYKNKNNYLDEFKNSLLGFSYINEEIFTKKSIKVKNPSNVFLEKTDITNKELNKYFISLFESLGMSIHYIDHSFIKELSAVQIFIPENLTYLNKYNKNYNFMSNKIIDEHLNFVQDTKDFINSILNGNEKIQSLKNKYKSLNKFTKKDYYDGSYIGTIIFGDWINILPTNKYETNSLFIFDLNMQEHYLIQNTIYFNNLKLMTMIKLYKNTNSYSNNEIKEIFKTIFNINVDDNDIINYNNEDYIFYKVIVQPTLSYYTSTEYKEMILSLIQKDIIK